ncbi:MAG: AsnC family transcriptional regulator [Steroidobacteraceae bacterium]
MVEPQDRTMTQIDWKAAQISLRGKLSNIDQEIVDLLAARKSTPDIAKALGTNRSAVWRRVQKIKALLTP